ncbi:MAG TPA: bifunctional diaminohydroxyphosphoribosylaminopyrimidine deaminase/5-amino-6-(5-phosphoribosylamino)uracil reductase RibD [Parvularculaceae bacterium]|nr:bifunctional diaminohydroxyphosphoribosylaminopyrimidine deaminase/5-amino-6-(5-phosphoribosylamino)uracil reductase RibD [Parvularculaceae bacterium]
MVDADRRYMLRALELAERGQGATSPNPMVGCVLVKDGAVVGEGWHARAGGPHAEIEAIAAAGKKARGATAYVSLEPCSHHGRTPPCTHALVEAGVAEVVYALADPNPIAAGGARKLCDDGVAVRSGVCADEAAHLNRFWLHSVRVGRPYVVAKFAMSLDGRIATRTGDSKWITGAEARTRAHQLRRAVDAIIVGAGTVIADDPSLTARPESGEMAYPLRVVLDSTGRTSPGAAIFDRVGRGALLAATSAARHARLDDYRQHGVDAVILSADAKGRPHLNELLSELKKRNCCGVMVEGGAEVLGSFFDARLVDEVWAFIAPIVIGGGKSAVAADGVAYIADAWRLANVETESIGPDLLIRGRVDRSA